MKAAFDMGLVYNQKVEPGQSIQIRDDDFLKKIQALGPRIVA
jgi:hypothetical protein